MWGFEEQWPSTVWDAHGFDVQSTTHDDTNFSTWASTSLTAGYVSGVRSCRMFYNYAWGTHGYDSDLWHEDAGGAGQYASGRVALTVMPDNLGGSGFNANVLGIYVKGNKLDGTGVAWASDSYPIARIYATQSGSSWTFTLYVANVAKAVVSIAMNREQPNRIGIDYFTEFDRYVARVTQDGVPISDWYETTSGYLDMPSEGIRLFGSGMNNTNSSSGLTGTTYSTCIDDIIFISDTITAINVTTQAVTRAEAEPPCPSGAYYIRALDVSSISANAGTWTGVAGDIDIADSDNAATKVETTDTGTAKPLRMDVDYAAVSGTAPASYLGMLVRNMESQVTMVTDLQLSEDNFGNTTGVMSEGTPGTSMTRREISTTVKANGGGDLDKTAIDAMELGYRVTA